MRIAIIGSRPEPTPEQRRAAAVCDVFGYAGHVERRYRTEVDPTPVCGLLAMASELDRRDEQARRRAQANTPTESPRR